MAKLLDDSEEEIWSPPSPCKAAITLRPPSVLPPAQPTGSLQGQPSQRSITFSWGPATMSYCRLQHYAVAVLRRESEQHAWIPMGGTDGVTTVRSFTVSDVRRGVQYAVAVTTVAATVEAEPLQLTSSPSEISAPVSLPIPSIARPRRPTASAKPSGRGNRTILFNWNRPDACAAA